MKRESLGATDHFPGSGPMASTGRIYSLVSGVPLCRELSWTYLDAAQTQDLSALMRDRGGDHDDQRVCAGHGLRN